MPLSYHLNCLDVLKQELKGIFSQSGSTQTYHKYVSMLYDQFIDAVSAGETYQYMDPFVAAITDIEERLGIVRHHVLNIAGPTSEQFAQVLDLEGMLRATVIAMEQLQMSFLAGGLRELQTMFRDRSFRFQCAGRQRENYLSLI